RRALSEHVMPGHPPPSAATTGDWRVPPVPDELRKPGIEISGPCSITSMFINALNAGPEGERAEGDLDDDEDSGGHRPIDAGRAQADRGQGIYFYLPKLEHAPEARWYRDLFDRSRELLPALRRATIRAVVLVESLPCVYQMEEMLWELGPYAAGLNAARWDL